MAGCGYTPVAVPATTASTTSTSRRCHTYMAERCPKGRMQRCGMPRLLPGRPRRAARVLIRAHLDVALLHSLGGIVDHFPLAYEPVASPCSLMKCGDVVHRSTLDLALRKELRGLDWRALVLLATAGAYLFATPGPLPAFIDYYFLRPLQVLLNKNAYDKEDILLGKKLASGGFGTVFRGELTEEDGRVKSVIVKKAKEFGEAEVWMNERMQRAAPSVCAEFITAFDERYGPSRLPQDRAIWIVWAYEGNFTLWDLMQKRDFPYNLETLLLDRELRLEKGPRRRLILLKLAARQLLEMLATCHNIGIVHRDFKPQNVIVSEKGKRLKMIDLGAAADLRIGVNYVPNEYLMDPRYAPPYRFIMSTQTPRPPPKPVAAFLSPVLWRMNRPDVFDSYSCGVTLLQFAFPALRSDNGLIAFNKRLEALNHDLNAWRKQEESRSTISFEIAEGLELLDKDADGGWDLICQLMKKKPSERLSATEALRHPWLGSQMGSSVPGVVSSVSQKVATKVKALKSVDMNFLGDVIVRAQAEGLTEGQIARELGYHAEAPDPGEASQTIAWWEERQVMARKKLYEKQQQLSKNIKKGVKNLQELGEDETESQKKPAPSIQIPSFFKLERFAGPYAADVRADESLIEEEYSNNGSPRDAFKNKEANVAYRKIAKEADVGSPVKKAKRRPLLRLGKR